MCRGYKIHKEVQHVYVSIPIIAYGISRLHALLYVHLLSGAGRGGGGGGGGGK